MYVSFKYNWSKKKFHSKSRKAAMRSPSGRNIYSFIHYIYFSNLQKKVARGVMRWAAVKLLLIPAFGDPNCWSFYVFYFCF